MGIGSFFGKLFGTEKALGGIVDGVTNGLDALIYTDEERAKEAAADRSEARKMVVQWMASTQGQNLARRLIALAITGTWLGMYLLSVLAGMVALFVNDTGSVTAGKVRAIGEIADSAAVDMNPAVMLILAFYFAAPHMGDIAKAVTGRFTQSVNKG
tara:strand:- start:538 stop:1005 length:468 start_codon:yes stop_codon:yes gene_type:complete